MNLSCCDCCHLFFPDVFWYHSPKFLYKLFLMSYHYHKFLIFFFNFLSLRESNKRCCMLYAFSLLNNYCLPFCVLYSIVLQDLLVRVLSTRKGYGTSWHVMQEKLLRIYEEALSSNCRHLVEMIQAMLRTLLFKDFGIA